MEPDSQILDPDQTGNRKCSGGNGLGLGVKIKWEGSNRKQLTT